MGWIYSDDTYHKYACKICGYKTSLAAVHNWEYQAEVPPTCISSGTSAGYKCSICDATSDIHTIPPTGQHVYSGLAYSYFQGSGQHTKILSCVCGKSLSEEQTCTKGSDGRCKYCGQILN